VTATREALIAAVLADPDDDLPRLVFADWCDEHGEPDRGEFVRLQVGLARCRVCHPVGDTEIDFACDCEDGLARQREFFDCHGIWRKVVGDARVVVPGGMDPVTSNAIRLRRGFAESIVTTAKLDVAHLDAVLAAHPVTSVTLTTTPGPEWATRACSQRTSGEGIDWVVAGRVVTASSIATTWPDILSARWPTVRTWHLPAESAGDRLRREHFGLYEAAYRAGQIMRVIRGDP
jgi:uncharacterized protein (TIGR02996 family)